MKSGTRTIIFLLCMQGPANGAYTVQMRMGSYSNPSNIDFQHICCDPHTLCFSPCDVYFTFCYRAINTGVTSAACWQQQSTMSNPIETGAITAPQTGPLYHNSPISNPITFTDTSGYPVSEVFVHLRSAVW